MDIDNQMNYITNELRNLRPVFMRNLRVDRIDSLWDQWGVYSPHISYVAYLPKCISMIEKTNDLAYSDRFSGCFMGQFTFLDKKYIVHIETGEYSYEKHWKISWNHFISQIAINKDRRFKDFVLFKPMTENIKGILCGGIDLHMDTRCFGTIDENLDCYSGVITSDKTEIHNFQKFQNPKKILGVLDEQNYVDLLINL